MTIRGRVLLFAAVAFGCVALLGMSLYQGTSRGQIAREWSTRAHEQQQLYNQLRGDAFLYLVALQQAPGAGKDTASVLAEQQRRLEAQFLRLRVMTEEEARWRESPRPEEKQRLSRLEQALRRWTEHVEVGIRNLPLQEAAAGHVLRQEALDEYRREVEPLLAEAIEEKRGELEEVSRQGERSLRIGSTLSRVIPLTALGLLLVLVATILLPMNRRFRELLASAERIGHGEFGNELTERGNDEFSTLARAFNKMSRELSATQARLLFADRLATMGRLAAGVGHEINNPLAYVISNLHYLHQELSRMRGGSSEKEWEELLDALSEARAGAERVRFIVQDIKALSRADDASNGPVELAAVVRGAARMVSHELRDRARVVEDCAQVPPVLGNAARLGQVFLNLLVNAAQAMPKERVEENEIRVVARLESPDVVAVEVRDTGSGIAPEHLERIFDAFFTTKPEGEGTGLGLAVCQTLITQLGGSIRVESKVGQGTTFRITLPVARNVTAA